jgi:ABC-type sugar transport system substrate-binding protein
MTQQLRETLENQEQRIAERTRALETSTEVSRRLSTILDQRTLVRAVVEQVQTAFDYYHTQIYLFDDNKENLIMVGGTGEAGQTMLERGHSIPKGRGLVGRAADLNLPVLVPNVERSIGYEIITTDTVEAVFERESTPESTKNWYANHISASFTDLQAFAERVAQKKAAGDQLPRLGYVLYGLNDFLGTIKMGAEEAAKSLGIDLEIVSADFDPDQGIRQFEGMIEKKFDGLIVQPDNPEKWVAPIQKAVEAGIPVLTTNLRFPGSVISAWFGQDSYQSGLMLGRNLQQVLAAAGKTSGEIVVASAREIQELHERYTGLKRSLQDTDYTLSEFYDAPLNEQQNIAAWEKLIQSHPDMIAAVGLASVDLPSMIRLKKRFKAEWIAAGYDLTVEVLEAIQDGTAQIAIGQHPYMQGYLPVLALAEHYIDGTPLEGWIVDGWQSNPLLPETRAEAAVPIAIGENVVGVLDVQDQDTNGLDETDAELLQSIANQVASALQNAQVYQQTQQQVAREALITNINQQIQSTTDVEEALQVAVRELGRALGTDTRIQLAKNSNGDQKTLETNPTEE